MLYIPQFKEVEITFDAITLIAADMDYKKIAQTTWQS